MLKFYIYIYKARDNKKQALKTNISKIRNIEKDKAQNNIKRVSKYKNKHKDFDLATFQMKL